MAMPLQLFGKNPALQHTVVEIDKNFIRIAKKYFFPLVPGAASQLRVVHRSIESFAKTTTNKFPVIFQDIFVGDQAPAKFTSQKWLRHLKKLLNRGGVIIINIGNIHNQAEFLNMHNLHHFSRGVFRHYACLVDRRNCFVLLTNSRSSLASLRRNLRDQNILQATY
jgi:spermidine synthase